METFLSQFITESNKLDRQYKEDAILLAERPGQLMYDNYVRAWEHIQTGRSDREIHNLLFEGVLPDAGKYRTDNFFLFGRTTPTPSNLDARMKKFHTLINIIKYESPKEDPAIAENTAWKIHDVLYCIHPFEKGTGAVARLLMNHMRIYFGIEPIVVEYKDRQRYKEKVLFYRDNYFKEWI